MPESLRALVVILVLALPTMAWAQSAMSTPTMNRPAHGPGYWQLWLTVTLFAFTIPSLALFLVFVSLFLMAFVVKKPNPMAQFMVLILAIPSVWFVVPAFGLIDHLAEFDFVRLVILVFLVPAFFLLGNDPADGRAGRLWVLLFLGWLFALTFMATNFTTFLRTVFQTLLDVLVPFEIGRRSVRRIDDLQRISTAFVTVAAGLSLIAIFEYSRHWLLYASLPAWWGTTWGLGHYLDRGGALRAQATMGQPINLGYVLAIAFVLALPRSQYGGRPRRRLPMLILIAGGLFASLSRGPWLGAIAGCLIYLALKPKAARTLLITLFLGAFTIVVLPLVPGGEKIYNLLPFVGKSDVGSETYRHDLLLGFWDLLVANPITGVPDYDTRPELQYLRQGEGIIDLVNTYLGVAVGSGFPGLLLFIFAHSVVLFGLWRSLKRFSAEGRDLASAFLAAYLAAMLIIATTSSIGPIATVYWSFAGIASGLIMLANKDRVVVRRRPASRVQLVADPATNPH